MSPGSEVPRLGRAILPLVTAALAEDAPEGDVTAETLIPASVRIIAQLRARVDGVLAGSELVDAAFSLTDPEITVRWERADGEPFAAGDLLAEVVGPARGVLTAERVALNFLQRMCGIATLTRRYVEAVAGSGARITDTRKTTPGLRRIERQAVRCGGGHNHRSSLSQAFMAKDNHLALTGDLTEALVRARRMLPHTVHLEVEVDRLDQLEAVLAAGVVDTIMLDNMSLEDLRSGVGVIGGRAFVEASGGVDLSTVRGIAETGVDLISVGALTHQAPALDLGLDLDTP